MDQTVRRHGSAGPLVLCLHGGPGAPGEVAPVAARLGMHYRVLEPFERRSGATPLSLTLHANDLAQLVLGEEAPHAAVVGFSSGAITALTFAASWSHLCRAVVLIGAATVDAESRAEFKRRLAGRLGPAASARLAELRQLPASDEVLEAQAKLLGEAYFVDPVSLPQPAWVDAQGHGQTWQDMLRLQEAGEHPRSFRSIRSPVLMIHGADDPHPGPMIRDSLRAVMPQLEYVELAACGHYPWLERAAREEFQHVLESWLAQHAPQ